MPLEVLAAIVVTVLLLAWGAYSKWESLAKGVGAYKKENAAHKKRAAAEKRRAEARAKPVTTDDLVRHARRRVRASNRSRKPK